MNDFLDKHLMTVVSILTIISVIGSVVFCIGLIWYAIVGNPAADIGHFIKTVKDTSK